MTFKVIRFRGQGQGEEMTSVPYQDYFYVISSDDLINPVKMSVRP